MPVYYPSYTARDNEILIVAFHCGCIPNVAFEVSKKDFVPEDGGNLHGFWSRPEGWD